MYTNNPFFLYLKDFQNIYETFQNFLVTVLTFGNAYFIWKYLLIAFFL